MLPRRRALFSLLDTFWLRADRVGIPFGQPRVSEGLNWDQHYVAYWGRFSLHSTLAVLYRPEARK